jgi:hypothetical protein
MTGAQAQEYYGMERDYKKSDKKDVSVKSIKCNNINVNVNGLELNVLPPVLGNLLGSEAQASDEGERGASSYGSGGGSYGSEKSRSDGDFKFVCINNNNNTVVGVDEEEPPKPPVPLPPVETCAAEIELCFSELLDDTQLSALVTALGSQAGITINLAQGITITFHDFEDICEFLQSIGGTGVLQHFLHEILRTIGVLTFPLPEDFLSCVEDALLIEIRF